MIQNSPLLDLKKFLKVVYNYLTIHSLDQLYPTPPVCSVQLRRFATRHLSLETTELLQWHCHRRLEQNLQHKGHKSIHIRKKYSLLRVPYMYMKFHPDYAMSFIWQVFLGVIFTCITWFLILLVEDSIAKDVTVVWWHLPRHFDCGFIQCNSVNVSCVGLFCSEIWEYGKRKDSLVTEIMKNCARTVETPSAAEWLQYVPKQDTLFII